MRYGRPTNIVTQLPYEDPRAPRLVLVLGLAILVGFFHLTLWQADTIDPVMPQDTLAVMAMQDVQRPTETTAVAEPFGYYEGQWNLWEYLGDLFFSFLT